MATHKSYQLNKVESQDHDPLKPSHHRGKMRVSLWNFQADRDVSGGAAAQNDDVELCRIPKHAVLLGGWFKHGAFGAGTVLDVGLKALDGSGYLDAALSVADDPDALATDLDIAAAGSKTLFELTAYNFYETEKELVLTCKFEGANPADNVELYGYIEYAVE